MKTVIYEDPPILNINYNVKKLVTRAQARYRTKTEMARALGISLPTYRSLTKKLKV